MSGITSGTGLFSGINSTQLIDQLLAIDARPKTLAQRRILQLQGLQAAYLDVNSKVSALRTSAQAFNLSSLFKAAAASSSNQDVLTASATTGAVPGSYSFIVDRLVSTQQSLSTGFVSSNNDGAGITKITLESTQARLDRDTDLATLNGGNGIARGKIVITDSSGASATVDLSRVASVNEVLTTINNTSGIRVRARVDGDRFIVDDLASGGGTLTVANGTDSTTATSLGIAGTAVGGKITGQRVNTVGTHSALRNLNGGLGVAMSSASGVSTPDFRITTRAGNTYDIDIGDMFALDAGVLKKTKSAATDLAAVIQRINEQTAGAVTATIDTATNSLKLVDNSVPDSGGNFIIADISGQTTAADLGIVGTTSGDTLNGNRLNAALNSTLARNLRGGAGISGNADLGVTTADGTSVLYKIGAGDSISDIIANFNANAAGKATLSLNANGTSFTIKDNTTGPGQLTLSGDGATSLGFTAGAAASGTATSGRSQLKYFGLATRLDSLNGGAGLGTGSFELVDSYGQRSVVNISSDLQTVSDLVRQIQNASPDITARINDNGDGILITEKPRGTGPGGQKIAIKDINGAIARNLNLVGTASGVGASNKIDGSLERTLTFTAADTLDTINTKINEMGVMVSSSVVNDGSGSRPYRLSLTARQSGLAGAFLVETEGADLGFSTVSQAANSRVFYGSNDPARALLFSSTTNSISGAVEKVSINLKSVNANPVTVTITQDTAAVEKGISDFIDSFNALIASIDGKSTYDKDANKRGVLLGDSTTVSLRSELFATVTGPALGVNNRFRSLADVGITALNGKLSLNTDKLRTAMALDPKAVADIFAAKTAQTNSTDAVPVLDANGVPIPGAFTRPTSTGSFTSLGIMERIAQVGERYVNSVTGVFTRQNKGITDQITAQNTRISTLDAAIERKRVRLTRQFANMESAIGKLQSQQGSLGTLANLAASAR